MKRIGLPFIFLVILQSLSTQALASDCSPQALAPNTTITGNLSTTDCTVNDLLSNNDSSLVDVYQFVLSSEDTVTITMDSNEIDPLLRLLTQDLGTTIAEDDDSGSNFNATINTTLEPGTYNIVANSATGESQTGSYTIRLEATQTATPSRIVNISTRGQIKTGDEVMIGGLIISGSSPKTVYIRAMGPNLANFNVEGVLTDPTLQLFSGSDLIDQNDDWDQHSRAGEVPQNLTPTFPQESVIVATLEPGAYTAIVRGVMETTGVGLVEVYEANGSESPKLVNISTRGFVGEGDNVMIGGLIITGTEPKTVVIRAVGPSLANFGVPGVLADPNLQLFSGADLIDQNNNWQDHSNADQVPSELRPTDERESVIVTTLNPGAYTAIVRGIDGATGVGLVEVFEL